VLSELSTLFFRFLAPLPDFQHAPVEISSFFFFFFVAFEPASSSCLLGPAGEGCSLFFLTFFFFQRSDHHFSGTSAPPFFVVFSTSRKGCLSLFFLCNDLLACANLPSRCRGQEFRMIPWPWGIPFRDSGYAPPLPIPSYTFLFLDIERSAAQRSPLVGGPGFLPAAVASFYFAFTCP